MKKLAILILLINVTCLLQGQDIIYTVSCEKDGVNTNLDSIMFENLSNDSYIVFGPLSYQASYAVNLSSQRVEVNTSLTNFVDEDQMFRIVKNIPGKISILYKFDFPEDIKLSVIDLNGQILYTQNIDASIAFNTINIEIPNSGFYIINLQSPFGEQSFKVVGSGRSGTFSSSINMNKPKTNDISLKSALFETESDFSFQQGDSLKIIAYLNGNSTYPITFEVNESDSLNLFFVNTDDNYFIVNNVKYPLNLGYHVWGNAKDCGSSDGSNIFIHGLYLSTDITIGKYEPLNLLPSGKGNILIFNMLNRDSILISGEYSFIDKVDCLGVVTDGDSTYQMSSTDKFVTRKPKIDSTQYAINVDIEIDWNNVDFENPSEEVINKYTNYINAGVGIIEGSITIEKNENMYTITIDCIDLNGLKVVGRFSGQLNWILFDV